MGCYRIFAVGALTCLLAAGATAAPKEEPVVLTVGTGDFPGARQHPHPVACRAIRCEPGAGHRGRVRLALLGSQVPLNGEQAPRSNAIFLKNLPAGYYEVIATLETETGPSKVVREKFQVVAGRGDTQ